MTHRERVFHLLEGRTCDRTPFFPDITDWYKARRTEPGQPQKYHTGELIPDDEPFHQEDVDMPAAFRAFTLMDFYREFDWGIPIHVCDWFDVEYEDVTKSVTVQDTSRLMLYECPAGRLEKVERLAEDGSWAPSQPLVKSTEELAILRFVLSRARTTPRYERIARVLDQIGEIGVCDVVIARSPFGKLLHEYMGIENVVYSLHDHEPLVLEFLEFQEQLDLQLVEMAAHAPARIVIISDHADDSLISPAMYQRFCIPFYQKACRILHAADKIVSTHLDGSFKHKFSLLEETGFDLLDGCTPAPMSNYELEELAEALPNNMLVYCGVPSVFFLDHHTFDEVRHCASRIVRAFDGRVILNVGDVLPPTGSIEKVIELGKLAQNGDLCKERKQ